MNAILINSSKREVTNIDLSILPHIYLRQIQDHLCCQTYKFATYSKANVQFMVDEDFLRNESNLAFQIEGWPLPFFGNVIIIGKNPDSGDTIDLPEDLTPESFNINFFSEEQTKELRIPTQALSELFSQPDFELKAFLEAAKK